MLRNISSGSIQTKARRIPESTLKSYNRKGRQGKAAKNAKRSADLRSLMVNAANLADFVKVIRQFSDSKLRAGR